MNWVQEENIEGNVAIYLTIVNTSLKSTETDLDFSFFCTLVFYSLATSMYQWEESIPVLLLMYLLIMTS